MNYAEAVSLARAGEERGFGFLYQNTYRSKYYLALQYMKNEEAAKDVLQEAYIKAFSKLDTLSSPEAFPGWLGTIVANTAKNMLAKKNPLLFSDIAADEDNESFEYQIEDENIENQPEISYTRQETQALVHEMIDSLSDEQRMCILMFHIEGASVSEIASVMNCSENTVKSRLNYGRKNLKIKAEELRKKGYRLYSIAPVPLLLYLLRADEADMAADGTLAAAGELVADRVFSSVSAQPGPAPSAQAQGPRGAYGPETDASQGMPGDRAYIYSANGTHPAADAAVHTAANTAKAGFLHTAAGKAVVIILGACVAGGAVYYGAAQLNRKDPGPEVTQEENPGDQGQGTEGGQSPEEVRDAQYPVLVEGNLTKEELEFVLSCRTEELESEGSDNSDYTYILNSMLQISDENGGPIENYGADENWHSQYSLEDVNRMLSAFTDYQITEENDSDTENGINVEGDRLVFPAATINFSVSADITSAEYTEDEMDVYFTYVYTRYATDASEVTPPVTTAKKAELKPEENGMFRIVNIEDAAQNPEEDTENSQTYRESTRDKRTLQEVYTEVLRSVQKQEPGYEFPNAGTQAGGYRYFVHDMDGDGIEELIVGAEFSDGMNGKYILNDCRVFSCTETEGGFELKQIEGNVIAGSVYIASDGNGLYGQTLVSGGTGRILVKRLTIQNGTFAEEEEPAYEFILGDEAAQQFAGSNPAAEWTDLSDLSGLSGLS